MYTTKVTQRDRDEISHVISESELKHIISHYMTPPPIVTKEQLKPISETTIYLYQRDGPNTVGHWTCVIYRGSDEAEYFDSYGQNFGLSDVRPYISTGRRLQRSSVPLQRLSPAVQDCGAWVADRLKHVDKSYDQYVAMVKAAGPNHDIFVVRDIY